MESNKASLLSLAHELFEHITQHLDPFDLQTLDECRQEIRSRTHRTYWLWYLRDLQSHEKPPRGTSDWKRLALARYRLQYCEDISILLVDVLFRAWTETKNSHRHETAASATIRALAFRVWMYHRYNQIALTPDRHSGISTINRRHLERTQALTTASIILGYQEASALLYSSCYRNRHQYQSIRQNPYKLRILQCSGKTCFYIVHGLQSYNTLNRYQRLSVDTSHH